MYKLIKFLKINPCLKQRQGFLLKVRETIFIKNFKN